MSEADDMTEANSANEMNGTSAANDAEAAEATNAANTANGNEAEQQASSQFQIILASASPRRAQLLHDAGVEFSVLTPSTPIDETLEPDQLADPIEAAKKLAEKKAGAAVQDLLAANATGNFIVIGADTMVVKDGEIFGKPRGFDDGVRMLKALSGSTHEVVTGVSLWMIAAPSEEDVSLAYRTLAELSRVTFKPLSDEDIAEYLRKGESFDKAGAYAIQGEGAALVDHYDGAYDNIVGLPVERLLREFPDLKA